MPVNGLLPAGDGVGGGSGRRINPNASKIAICVAIQVGAPERAALFIVIFSTHNVREPEVFADLIPYIHTLQTPVLVLNYVNLRRLQNWAKSLPRAGFLMALHPPNCSVSRLSR